VEFTEIYPADAASQPLAGMRFPDSIAFSPDGQYLISADEGEQKLTGGRGISIWSLSGELVWDDGGEIEQKAAAANMYPDKRSAKRGVEIEGVAAGHFGARDFAFAVAEYGSFLVIYDITNPYAAKFVQLLPTGKRPESVAVAPAANLVVVGSEDEGVVTIYRYKPATTRDSALKRWLK
jgi:hypothetical protein